MSEPIFSSAEINLLLKRARSSGIGSKAGIADKKAAPFDFQGVGQLSEEQVAGISQLHEGFAKRLGQALSGLVGAACEASLTGTEQSSYSEIAAKIPAVCYLAMLRIQSPEASALIQADLGVVLSMIDLMLGGLGTPTEAVRNLTDIEQEIFRPVMQTVCDELRTAWFPMIETGLRLDQSVPAAASALPATEKILILKFQIQLGEVRREWALVLPSLIVSALTRKLAPQAASAEHGTTEQNQLRMREKLLDSRFGLELFLPPSTVSVKDLAKLRVGQVIVLKTRSTDPIHLNVEGQNMFQASPVGCGAHRGAQVKRALTIVTREPKEAR